MPTMTQLPEAIELETAPAPDAAVIWLHGLGADGRDFEAVVPELGLAPALGSRIVFSRAAGILALPTPRPLPGRLAAERSAANRDLPVFMAHGTHDPMIGIPRARA